MSKVCRAAVFEGPGIPLALREFPIRRPTSGEVRVVIECCTVCGSDLHTISGLRNEAVPTILGHEILGHVAEVAGHVVCVDGAPLSEGDRITWSSASSCGSCDRCCGGLPQKCRSLFKYGHEKATGRYALSGGLAEEILLRPGSAVMQVPAELPAELICPVNCATATVVAAFRAAGKIKGERVLIIGAGMLGLTAAAYAGTLEPASVTLCDVRTERLAAARRYGATDCLDVSKEPPAEAAFDVVLELSGAAEANIQAVKAGDVGSRVVLVGAVKPTAPLAIIPELIIRRCMTIHGVHNYAPQDLQQAVGFLSEYGRQFPLTELVEASYSLSEVNAAVESALENRPVRIAVRP